jgi:hypothetical protein
LINSDKLSLLYVELFFLNDFPFVKTAAAEGFAFVFFKGAGLFEGNYVAHIFIQRDAIK